MRRTALVIIIAILLAFAGIAAVWDSDTDQSRQEKANTEAETLIGMDQPREALAILRTAPEDPASDGLRRELEIRALARLGSSDDLLRLYRHWPKSVMADEDASLLVFQSLSELKERRSAAAISQDWSDRTIQPEKWFCA